MRYLLIILVGSATTLLISSASLLAQEPKIIPYKLCNDTPKTLLAAAFDGASVYGWLHLLPNQCKTINVYHGARFEQPAYYALSPDASRWTGRIRLCVSHKEDFKYAILLGGTTPDEPDCTKEDFVGFKSFGSFIERLSLSNATARTPPQRERRAEKIKQSAIVLTREQFDKMNKARNSLPRFTPPGGWEKIEEDRRKAAKEPIATFGVIQDKCIAQWYGEHHLHAVETKIDLHHQSIKVTMKKLNHCIRLQVVGPIDIQKIAKRFVDECVDKGLNDQKVAHLLKLLAGIVADVYGTGGAGTAAAIADYFQAVADRTLSCLTSERELNLFLTSILKDKFNAVVTHETNWEYWTL